MKGGFIMDKVLITNVSAQKIKYGARGYRRVRDAIGELVAADLSKCLKTQLVDISDPSQMRRYRATAVSNPRSEVQNKNAIDRVYSARKPHYLVLIDGPDIIPHILLNNPIPGDIDKNIPSDLPYASDEPFTRRDAATYAEVTRVVGRIPGVTGSSDATFLISQIKNAAAFKSRKRDDYLSHFALSAYVYRKSTEQSVDNIFRGARIKISPPTDSPKIGMKTMAPLSHFINCEGRSEDPNFYGRRGNQIVVSMTSEDVTEKVKRNTIVAAECCYGAQLFAPADDGKLPIASAYLKAGAIGFFGSTNVAYGAHKGNGSADLIAQYFLIEVLGSASTGRACLQARQKFVQSQKMENPVNLKTLAQFILLGDPSLQAVRGEAQADDSAEYVDFREARRTRRIALVAAGKVAPGCSGFPGRKIMGGETKLRRLVRKIALQKGFKVGPNAVEAYEIVGGKNYASEMKARGVKQKVFVAMHRENAARKTIKGVPLTRVLVVHAQNDSLTGAFEYSRR
jgi:hypothetical protein